MKRFIVTICALSASLGAACSSGPGTSLAPPNGDRIPPSNTNQAASGSEDPLQNPDQPNSGSDQPLFNSDGPGGGGGTFDCATFCQTFACLIDDSAFRGSDCVSECNAELPNLSSEDLACLDLLTDVFVCLEQAGFDCEQYRRAQDGELDYTTINQDAVQQCQRVAEESASCVEDIGSSNNVEVNVGDGPPPDVGQAEFVCDNGSTVLFADEVCDGFVDCADGTDEPPGCPGQ